MDPNTTVTRFESLSRRVANLEERLSASAQGRSAAVSAARPGTILAPPLPPRLGKPDPPAAGEQDSLSDEVIRWASRASLFPRLATLCFLMVIALTLRTITDNGIVNTLIGMGLGMGYALVHFGAAFWLAMRKMDGVPGTNSFVVAGSALLGLALPAALGGVSAAPALGAVALGVAVLSFGLAAATQSITLSRWQKAPPIPAPESPEPDKETASALGE